MTQPSRVIYLPPGVMPGPQANPPAPVFTGVPFDRGFFEKTLQPSIESFCSQAGCNNPVLELMTVDGTTHFVNGISGVSDAWVALHTSRPEQTHPVQVFIPYQTIYRVEIHGDADEKRGHLGFFLGANRGVPPSSPPGPPGPPSPPSPPVPRATARKAAK